jgi:hypothetical protein
MPGHRSTAKIGVRPGPASELLTPQPRPTSTNVIPGAAAIWLATRSWRSPGCLDPDGEPADVTELLGQQGPVGRVSPRHVPEVCKPAAGGVRQTVKRCWSLSQPRDLARALHL